MTSTRSEVSIWQELRERRVVRVGLVYLEAVRGEVARLEGLHSVSTVRTP